jgi:hypothetical protein
VGWAVGPTQKHLPSYWVKPIIRLIIWLAAEHELIHVLHANEVKKKTCKKEKKVTWNEEALVTNVGSSSQWCYCGGD